MSHNGKNLWSEVARQVSTAGTELWSHGFSWSISGGFFGVPGMLVLPMRAMRQGRARRRLQTIHLNISPLSGYVSGCPRWNPKGRTRGSEDQEASHGNIFRSIRHASSSCSGYPACHHRHSFIKPNHQDHITVPTTDMSCPA